MEVALYLRLKYSLDALCLARGFTTSSRQDGSAGRPSLLYGATKTMYFKNFRCTKKFPCNLKWIQIYLYLNKIFLFCFTNTMQNCFKFIVFFVHCNKEMPIHTSVLCIMYSGVLWTEMGMKWKFGLKENLTKKSEIFQW